jgi:hypothetical protein
VPEDGGASGVVASVKHGTGPLFKYTIPRVMSPPAKSYTGGLPASLEMCIIRFPVNSKERTLLGILAGSRMLLSASQVDPFPGCNFRFQEEKLRPKPQGLGKAKSGGQRKKIQ